MDGRKKPLPVVKTQTFGAKVAVEVRMVLGGEPEWDFEWVTFLRAPER